MSDVVDEARWREQVFREHEFSVVRLHSVAGNDFRGNGFIVYHSKTRCLIVSCQHVVKIAEDGGTMYAYFSNSVAPYNARVLYTDEHRDLALLWAEEVVEPMTSLRFFDSPYASGWSVVALSFISLGASSNPILEPGTFSGDITNEPDEPHLHCSCSSKEATSGSPIILANVNEVVGVLGGASRASVYAVPVRTIKEFLGQRLGGVNVKPRFFHAVCYIYNIAFWFD
ncbi:unnamed protein product [Triticum turgidum subsp. durum]|uniref:Serine protease n=1 Tax=Triticum turgidum subsp. durum TaxID=4567 RepID=A0A9R1Q968_TRITD|nr:unnamed protein product [Triticum turgidum subsp. durum]